MVMTVVVMSGAVVAPEKASAAAQAGDLIKMDGLSAVYYLGDDGQRYVFPNSSTYMSWYSDFSGVVTVPSSELQSYPIGGNVTMRPGTNLVKITTDPTVYAVEPGSELRSIVSEENAIDLYGADWADKVVDVPDAFFVNYDKKSALTEGEYPTGTLLQEEGGSDVYYVDNGDYRMFDGESAFLANNLNWSDVVTTDMDITAGGSDITGFDADIFNPAGGASTSGDVPTGSGLSAALSASTPAASTIPAGGSEGTDMDSAVSLVPFTDFNLTAANDGDVKVDDLTLQRIGIGNNDAIGDVYIYEGEDRLTRGRSLNVDGGVTFGLEYTIPAGQTKTLTVYADLTGEAGGAHGFAVKEASSIDTSATVSGSFPITGNTMSLDTEVSNAVVKVELTDGSDLSADSLKVGENEQELVEVEIEEMSSEEDVYIHSIALTNEGSVDISDLSNFVLMVDGAAVAEKASCSSDRLNMVLDEALLIDSSETFVLKADIDRGAGDTVLFEIDSAVDVKTEGVDFGFGAGVDSSSTWSDSETGAEIVTSDFSITEASNNPANQDVAIGEDDVVFLVAELDTQDRALVNDFKVKVDLDGEDSATSTNDYLENLTVYLDDSRIAGPLDVNLNDSSNNPLIVNVDYDFEVEGIQELKLVADITDDADAGKYTMEIDTMDVEDMGGNSVDLTGSAISNDVEVGLGQPMLASDGTFGGDDVVAGTDDVLVGQYVLEAGENEDLDINSFNVKVLDNDGTASITSDVIDNIYVNDESSQSVDVNNVKTFNVNETLAKGETKKIYVYLDLDSEAVDGSEFRTELYVDAEGAISGDDYSAVDGFNDEAFKSGQNMNVAPGGLTLDVTGTPKKDIIIAGQEDVKVAEFEFTSTNDSFNVTDMKFDIYNADTDGSIDTSLVTELKVNDGEYKTVTNGQVTITDDIVVGVDEDKVIEVMVKLNDDFIAITSGEELYVQLSEWKETSDSTNETVTVDNEEKRTSNTLAVYNTNITVDTTKGSALNLGNVWNEVMDISITADAADRAIINSIPVKVTSTGTATTTAVRLLDSDGEAISDDVNTSTDGVYYLDIISSTDGRISAGTTETFTVEVDVDGAASENSITVELVEDGFDWSDNEEDNITDNVDLIDDLSGAYELIRE